MSDHDFDDGESSGLPFTSIAHIFVFVLLAHAPTL